MAQNGLVVVGIDVAKDKVDACIRSLALRQSWPSTVQSYRKLIAVAWQAPGEQGGHGGQRRL